MEYQDYYVKTVIIPATTKHWQQACELAAKENKRAVNPNKDQQQSITYSINADAINDVTDDYAQWARQAELTLM
eukprot:10178374-Karenia_brevis.AAC.1